MTAPTADRIDPLPRSRRLGSRPQHLDRLFARFDTVEPDFVGPRFASPHEIVLVIDQSRHNGPSSEINALRVICRQLRNLLSRADRCNAVTFDGYGLSD